MDPATTAGIETFLHYLNAGGPAPLYFLAYIGWRFHQRLARIENKLFPGEKNATL
jgi:hypothetical protein